MFVEEGPEALGMSAARQESQVRSLVADPGCLCPL